MALTSLRSRLDLSLPAGAPLSDEVYARRHTVLRWLLGAHLVLLPVFGFVQRFGVAETAIESAPAFFTLLLSTYLKTTRARAALCSLGLVWCSFAVIHISQGSIEAQLHLYVVLAFVALYQDWAPFLLVIVGDCVIYLATAAISPRTLFGDDREALEQPFLWAAIGCAAIGLLGVALLNVWNQAEERAQAAAGLATELDRTELEHLDDVQAERQRSADMLTQLARRNQGLLARQVSQLSHLPVQRQGDVSEVTGLAQRMRRNAESLLVLAGEDAKRMWTNPEPFSRVLAQAVDALGSQRVQVQVSHEGTVNGGLVRDLQHLVTELADNALTWTPIGLGVQVRAGQAADGRWLVMVDDHGPGLSSDQLMLANERLRTEGDIRYADVEQLGLQVVSRLAQRHHLDVSLVARAEGGLTAVIWIPVEAITQAVLQSA